MTINRIAFLFCFALSLASCGEKATKEDSTSTNSKPNILFLMIDDLNDWVGHLNVHEQTLTPNIDRLASEGMAFLNAHTNAPLCGPSRSSMLTGLRPSTTGIYFHIGDPDLVAQVNSKEIKATLLPDFFKQQGYSTLGVGKIFHWGDAGKVFDEYGGLSNFGPRPEERFAYDPTWFDKPKGTSTDWGAFPTHDSLTFDKRIADWAIDQLQQSHDGPVFLAAGFMRPHVPWYVPQKWLERFDSLEIDLPEYLADDWSDIPGMAEKITDLEMMPEMEWMQEGGRWESAVKSYLASVHFVDHQIGRVLKALEESEMAKNTIIVLASDHGYHLGEKGLFQKSTLWHRSTHIPMVWAGKGIEKGTSDEPVSLIDIYPTLASLISERPGHELEGKSLMPLLKKEQVSVDNYALTTYGPNNHSVIAGSWHYIRYNDGSEELYNLTEDQAEHHNLAGEPSVQAIKQGLRERLPSLNLDNNRYSALHNTPYFEAYNHDEK